MTMGMPGFAGRGDFEFTPGSVLGVRWWTFPAPDVPYEPFEIPVYGAAHPQLTGNTGYAWQPGLNEAVCGRGRARPAITTASGVTLTTAAQEMPGHEVPEESCACGFWAYWSEQVARTHAMGYGPGIPVVGVVEGFGRTLIGDKGFRAQKARIVAVHVPCTLVLTRGSFNARAWKREPDVLGAAPDPIRETMKAIIEAAIMGEYPRVSVWATARAMYAKYPPGAGYLLDKPLEPDGTKPPNQPG
jgi:hypothetical protein